MFLADATQWLEGFTAVTLAVDADDTVQGFLSWRRGQGYGPEARIAADKRDFEARFKLAALHAHGGRFDAAFEQLLEIVLRDKDTSEEGWREKARRQLVEWFEVCPDPEVVSHGRRYLGMYLN